MKFLNRSPLLAAGILSGLIASTNAGATEPPPLTLKQAYELALTNDPQWSAQRNQYRANTEVVAKGRAGLLPQANLTGTHAEVDVDYDSVLPDDDYDSDEYTASIQQPLVRVSNWYDYQSAKSLSGQYDAEFQQAQEAFWLKVVTRYLAVLRAEADLSYRSAELEAISRQLDQSEQRFKVGLIAITDVHEARAARDAAQSARIAAESQLFVAQRQLETIIGQTITEVAAIKEDMPTALPEPNNLEQWIEWANERNAGLNAARAAAESARANYKARRAEHLPTLDLVASHTRSDTGALLSTGQATPETSVNQLSLQLNVPLYSGGLTSANRRQSFYQLEAARDTETLQERQTNQAVTNFYQLVIASAAQVKASKQSALSSKVALDATRAGYKAGTRTVVDVLNAQRTLFQSQRDATNALFDYLVNHLNLLQVSGRLTEADILALNQYMVNLPAQP